MYQNQACQNTPLHSIRNESRLIRKFSRPVPILSIVFSISYFLSPGRRARFKLHALSLGKRANMFPFMYTLAQGTRGNRAQMSRMSFKI